MAAPPDPPERPRAGAVLEREALVAEVLEQNPSLSAARASERAAHASIGSVRAFDDLMVSYSLAPLSIGSDRVPFGQTIAIEQALPFPGKRGLRAEVAKAQERVAGSTLQAARLQLALRASQLYDQYFFVHRALAINEQHLALLEALKQSAEAQYVVGRAAQQDALQAEVELGQLLRERLTLRSERAALTAQLNALLHRRPEAPLKPPPSTLASIDRPPPESARLQAEALHQRPELAALRARMGGSEAAVELAELGYYPDLRVMGSYNTMWMDRDHQFMVGVALSLPVLQLGARKAVLEGARAELSGVRADEAALLDSIRADIHEARARLLEAQDAIELHRARLLPASRDQVAAARAGFTSGRNSFQAVMAAERNLRTTELQLEQAVAATHSRLAELLWSVGRLPGLDTPRPPAQPETSQPVSQP